MHPPVEPVPEDDRSALRFLAFWIGNGTVLHPGHEDVDYLPRLQRPGPWLGGIFAAWVLEDQGGPPAMDWWLAALDPARPDPTLPEVPPGPPWAQALCRYMDDYANGRLDPETIGECDPLELLDGEGGSPLEAVVAVLLNHLDRDPAGAVQAETRGRWRATQMVRSWLDPSYEVAPAWEDWETVLY
jgi:hypothetical protein